MERFKLREDFFSAFYNVMHCNTAHNWIVFDEICLEFRHFYGLTDEQYYHIMRTLFRKFRNVKLGFSKKDRFYFWSIVCECFEDIM